MKMVYRTFAKDPVFSLAIFFLISSSMFVLYSVSPGLFPSYLVYVVISVLAFFLFSRINFDILRLFSTHFYVISLLLLIATLILGQVTRGTIRWIPIGGFSFQPAEIVRPFLLIFFAEFLAKKQINLNRLVKALILLAVPVSFILIQPSLGISILTVVGFMGVMLAQDFDKKNMLVGISLVILILPLFWLILRPYQKARIMNFATPQNDPLGAGYNSIQSMIAVGSGKIYGRTLGKGVQTQLRFLPERQSDFIFASIGEELGFLGLGVVLSAALVLFWRLTVFIGSSVSPQGRAYISGFFLTLLAQAIVHAGMNMGILPVAGLPFPLVSAGGSSLLATSIGLGVALSCYRR